MLCGLFATIPNINRDRDRSLRNGTYCGRTIALEVCKKANIDPDKKADDLNSDEIATLRKILEDEYVIEGRLRTQVAMNINRLKDIACHRGLMHRKGLPVRGQRTKTNARTRKGKRKTVANKKKATK